MEITTIGLDLAKSIEAVVRKALRRAQVLPLFAKLLPCRVGMERAARHTTGLAS